MKNLPEQFKRPECPVCGEKMSIGCFNFGVYGWRCGCTLTDFIEFDDKYTDKGDYYVKKVDYYDKPTRNTKT